MADSSYKRTVAGSVGAGVGALFNASGRTYYILEHKTTSKYHNAGESQKIIIDQIELGRDSSCQVRYDESFETVSRKHAAIVRDGENWQLVHLSTSNPTLVNGQPIQGSYYLQSGDEIQLSVGGPRLGFIVPQGKQALTSSIRLTERMNLFRQQALRPYRRAIWILSALLILAILGFGAWNYKLSLDNQELRKEMSTYQVKLDSLTTVRQNLLDEETQLNRELEGASGARKKEIQQRIVYVQRELESVKSQAQQYQNQINEVAQKAADEGMKEDEITSIAPSATDITYNTQSFADNTPAENVNKETEGEAAVADGAIETNATAHGDASETIRDYYQHIYTLKLRRITIETPAGTSFDPQIPLSDVVCGTAFVLSNGTLVTARQNIEPWFYANIYGKDEWWRNRMAQYAAAGCNVILEYDAYSTAGTAKKLTFNNQDFLIDRSGDVTTEVIDIEKDVRVILKENGIDLSSRESHNRYFTFSSPTSSNYALLRGKGGVGIPYDAGASLSSDGGTEVQVAGYKAHTDIHNLDSDISYFKSSTSRTDTRNGTIVLQDRNYNSGYLGSPAFVREADGTYRVIGVMVGPIDREDLIDRGNDRIVPIASCN